MKKQSFFSWKILSYLSFSIFLFSCGPNEPQMPNLSTIKENRGQDSAPNTIKGPPSSSCKNAQRLEEEARTALTSTNAEIVQNTQMLKTCLENSTAQSVQRGACEHIEKNLKQLQELLPKQEEALKKAEIVLVAECNN